MPFGVDLSIGLSINMYVCPCVCPSVRGRSDERAGRPLILVFLAATFWDRTGEPPTPGGLNATISGH